MDLRLAGVLLLIPLLDVMLLVILATQLGAVATVALVVLTALIGLLLVRAEGRHTLRKLESKVAAGEIPTDELLDGGLILVAGALLLTPGLVTDLVGLVLVIPPSRYPVRVLLKKYVVTPYLDAKARGMVSGSVYTGGFPGASETGGGRTVEVDEADYRFDDADERDRDPRDGSTGTSED